jgi:alkylated DNA repair dioxygenase AlkB
LTEQLCFFPEAGQSRGLPKQMLDYRPGLFSKEESDYLLAKFIVESPSQQRLQKMWDKEVLTPRLTAWYGERLEDEAIAWTPELLLIKEKVEPLAGVTFNSVLLNYYRDGNDPSPGIVI